eukprot:1148669_1
MFQKEPKHQRFVCFTYAQWELKSYHYNNHLNPRCQSFTRNVMTASCITTNLTLTNVYLRIINNCILIEAIQPKKNIFFVGMPQFLIVFVFFTIFTAFYLIIEK